MNIEELVKKADSFYREATTKYDSDVVFLYEIALKAGIQLAKKYGADENVVRIGIAMMDSKLAESQALGMIEQHTNMAMDATKEMLKEIDVAPAIKENIMKCVEEHHGVEKYFSIESEIVANADCYKFIHPTGVFYYASVLGRRFHDFDKELKQLHFKLNEKYNVLSLEKAKEELDSYHDFFEKAMSEAKNN